MKGHKQYLICTCISIAICLIAALVFAHFYWGASGPQGLKGVQGEQGIQGLQGVAGSEGDVGSQGLQGIQGLKGETGERGLQGLQGLKGDKGDTGATGLQGGQGVPGSNLIVAMGFVYEQNHGGLIGNPRLVRSYNVGEVYWDANFYVISLSGIDYKQTNYIVQVTPLRGWKPFFAEVGAIGNYPGKLCVSLHTVENLGSLSIGFPYCIGSFLFVVFRYP